MSWIKEGELSLWERFCANIIKVSTSWPDGSLGNLCQNLLLTWSNPRWQVESNNGTEESELQGNFQVYISGRYCPHFHAFKNPRTSQYHRLLGLPCRELQCVIWNLDLFFLVLFSGFR